MFGSIGGTEVLIIVIIALVVFGPKRLPELGRTVGKGLREFRRASNDLKRSLEDEIALDDRAARQRDLDDD
jgi:TatA/E family protein of Tat protein translocase